MGVRQAVFLSDPSTLYSVRVRARVKLPLELAYLLGLQLLMYAKHEGTVSSDTTPPHSCLILYIRVGERINTKKSHLLSIDNYY